MTIYEAIQHCKEVAEREDKKADAMFPPTVELDDRYDSCRECASEHRQLAKWLEQNTKVVGIIGEWVVHDNETDDANTKAFYFDQICDVFRGGINGKV